jgi:AcrR family transcriptional regulator
MAGSILSEEELRLLVNKAIFEQLSAEAREKMITAAIEGLMKPVPPAYGRGEAVSPLEAAFRSVLYAHAENAIKAEFARPDGALKAKIEEVINRGVKRFVEDQGVVDGIAASIAQGLTGAFRER